MDNLPIIMCVCYGLGFFLGLPTVFVLVAMEGQDESGSRWSRVRKMFYIVSGLGLIFWPCLIPAAMLVGMAFAPILTYFV